MSCPICGKDTIHRYRPFCCKRCAEIDLGRWMTGAYAIPAEEEDVPIEDNSLTERAPFPTRH